MAPREIPWPMSSRKTVSMSGVAAAVLAIALIAGSSAFGVNIFSTGPVAQAGTLGVQVTDPPSLPPNVTAVYINYSDLQVHVAVAGSDSGWYTVSGSGELNLTQLVNVSMTVGSAPVSSGVYNILRFNISGAQVTYDGRNYTATVPSGTLTVPITEGGVPVAAGGSSGVMVDISTNVIPVDTNGTMSFILVPAARSVPIPQQVWHRSLEAKGQMMKDLGAAPWWAQYKGRTAGSLAITAVQLSSDHLSVTVENAGQANVTLFTISVFSGAGFPGAHGAGKGGPFSGPPAGLDVQPAAFPVAQFRIAQDGTLSQGMGPFGGYTLQPGQSSTFVFSGGQIAGFGRGPMSSGVVQGQPYVVGVLGSFGTHAYADVTAS